MKAYRLLWWSLAAPIGLAGVASAIASASVVPVLIVFALMALTIGTISANLQSLDGEGRSSGPISRSTVISHGCAAGLAVVAMFGLSSLIGVAALPLAILMAVSCPRVLDRWRASGRSPTPKASVEDSDERRPALSVHCGQNTAPAVEAMTGPELCMAWRRSFVELESADSAETRAAIANFRHRLLDELERRNPAGFEDWLASGARAPSDPARYILEQPNW
jgi:hypothetical protein